MKLNYPFRFLTVSVVLCLLSSITSFSNVKATTLAEDEIKKGAEDAKQAVLFMYDFIATKDLSDSLTFNQWTTFFTSDFLWIGSQGQAPNPMGKDGFKSYRGAFKTIKASFDGVTVDHVEASGYLAYVVYRFHEVVTSLKTNEVVKDAMTSAVVTLKKDAKGKWKIAFLAYN